MKARVPETAPRNPTRREAEADVLRVLCSGEESAAEMRAALERLAEYNWEESEHRVVHEAIARCRAKTGKGMREELPATATRMGFPDVEWKQYWGKETDRERRAETLHHKIEKLLKNKGAREE